MKGIILCAAGLLFLSGCALAPVGAGWADNIDHAKVQAINNAAWARGAQVHWRIYPTRIDKNP